MTAIRRSAPRTDAEQLTWATSPRESSTWRSAAVSWFGRLGTTPVACCRITRIQDIAATGGAPSMSSSSPRSADERRPAAAGRSRGGLIHAKRRSPSCARREEGQQRAHPLVFQFRHDEHPLGMRRGISAEPANLLAGNRNRALARPVCLGDLRPGPAPPSMISNGREARSNKPF